MSAVTEVWEVGGEFHLPVDPPGPYHRWPEGAVWYALGRHAVEALLGQLRSPRLWLPDYFCHEVAARWRETAVVELYEDDPRWPEPRWESLRTAPRDVVVAVNYFGVRRGAPWREWREETSYVLVEDHAHDPASDWATTSTADYAFSSLRKTLPVPDGAILWSPRGLPLPDQPAGGADGSELKLAAMLLKGEYLERGDDGLKDRFRRLQLDGEERLAEAAVSGASAATRESLVRGVPLPWRARRSENTARLLSSLHGWASPSRCSRSGPRMRRRSAPFSCSGRSRSATRFGKRCARAASTARCTGRTRPNRARRACASSRRGS